MEKDRIEHIWEDLVEDFEFFISQKESFRENFLEALRESKPKVLSTPGMGALVDRLYLLLFSFQKDPKEELFSLAYKLSQLEIDLKKALLKASLQLVRDYVDYIVRSERDYHRINSLIELMDVYLSIVEDATSKYIEELRSKVEEERREAEEKERRLLLEFLEKLQEEREREIELLTYYKEVPIVCRSKILKLEEDKLRVRTCHINIFKPEMEIYLKHRHIPQTVATRIIEVDVPKEELLLEVLTFVELPQERRRYVRVAPKEPIPVEIVKESREIVGRMADVSIGGVGVYLSEMGDLKGGDMVSVKFILPKGRVEAKGQVCYVIPYGEGFRAGIQYSLGIREEEIVSDYVMERQFEILKELRGIKD
ncbi:PilZ domain-containing protein [Hydrogenivirga caldilitoris]|uniref:PilZ domain-containing protein n=1 Tax=Hydrogenivirga caldilitoris TaxID=246264 RepID=A0A497XN73_9AQUI|nr:PilZ domain-containing protein [Hydrogenivirga caldilitoris]RLJ70375.1 PilZ domain-containing protein [Hydrogenivirga caldilitoris]